MSALDTFHTVVCNALRKDGWTITDDPLTLVVDGDRLFVDLGAERVLAAEKGTQKIAVEIKTFGGASKIADLQTAIGQYGVYTVALGVTKSDRVLYLAVPDTVLTRFFQNRELWKSTVERFDIRLIGYDPVSEEITQWLPKV